MNNEFEQKLPIESIVFQCTKCNQFTYAKATQKRKKCPRCGKNHLVAEMKGEIVNGSTTAMNRVKQLQNNSHPLHPFKSNKQGIPFQPALPKPSFITAVSSDFQVNKLLGKVMKWQQNEKISLTQGFPDYMIEYIAQEIEPDLHRRNKLIKKLCQLEQFTRLSNGNVFIQE